MQAHPEIFEFPCPFSLKAIGEDLGDYRQFVIDTVRSFVPDLDEAAVTTKKSQESHFTSVTVLFTAQSRAQLDQIYQALNQDERTRYLI